MKVGVMGAGRVGLASALVLSERGHHVTLVDVDAARVASLRAGTLPFFEPEAAAALAAAGQSGRWVVTDDPEALVDVEAVLIAVPTPAASDEPYDLGAVRGAAETLRAVGMRAGRHLRWRGVFLRSTVLPGTTERVLGTALAGLPTRCPVGFLPEFFREGTVLADARRPDRIVVGAAEGDLHALARALFDGIETTWFATGIRTAELVKTVNNALLASCVSFANEIARVAATVDGVDALDVLAGVHLDRRLRGAGIVDYLRPGPGFGGSCLPKDLAALAAFAGGRGGGGSLLDAALRINDTQPAWLVERMAEALGDLAGRRVLVLGLAFKPGTDDLRDTIAFPLCHALAARGAVVGAHDPEVDSAAARALLPSAVTVVPNDGLRDAFHRTDAALLVTPWPVYLEVLPALLAMRATPLLLADTRGILRDVQRSTSVTYLGIGARPATNGGAR